MTNHGYHNRFSMFKGGYKSWKSNDVKSGNIVKMVPGNIHTITDIEVEQSRIPFKAGPIRNTYRRGYVSGNLVNSSKTTIRESMELPGGRSSSSKEQIIINYSVTVVNNGGNKYVLNGIETPILTFNLNSIYKFDQSDSSNSTHPLKFYLDANKNTPYTDNVTVNGSTTEILITSSTPSPLYYQCQNHSNMGNYGIVSSSGNCNNGLPSVINSTSKIHSQQDNCCIDSGNVNFNNDSKARNRVHHKTLLNKNYYTRHEDLLKNKHKISFKDKQFSHSVCNSNISRCSGIVNNSNKKYEVQGAVDSGTRLERLKYETVNKNANSLKSKFEDGNATSNNSKYNGQYKSPYTTKSKTNIPYEYVRQGHSTKCGNCN